MSQLALFTDFGADDIYVGQLKSVLARHAPDPIIIDLLHSAPAFDIESSAQLLAALYPQYPPGSVVLAVVDPGVGGKRQPVVMMADGYWFVGPDNGLLAVIAARAQATTIWRIDWRPDNLSASFHGRDLFAPVAAAIARGEFPAEKLTQIEALSVTHDGADRTQVIYVDHYGNCVTGIRASSVSKEAVLQTGSATLRHARTFSEVEAGTAFWYENSIGLVEIAANTANAASLLGLGIGSPVQAS